MYHIPSRPFMHIVGDNTGDKIETYGFHFLSLEVSLNGKMDHSKRGCPIQGTFDP